MKVLVILGYDALMENPIYDSLTGLPSKELFDNNLALALASSRRSGEKTVILVIENPTGMFDAWLREIAARLRSSVRSTDTVAILNKDTFGIILTQLKDSDNAVRVADTLINKTREQYQHEGKVLRYHPLIGMAVFPDDAGTSEELLRNAQYALAGAKSNIVGRYAFYTEDMNARVHRRRTLLSSMLRGWKNDEFEVYAHPAYDVAGTWQSTVVSMRWNHSVEGVIREDEFFPLAVEAGIYQEMLNSLARRVLDCAARFPNKKWLVKMSPVVDTRLVATNLPFITSASHAQLACFGLIFDEAHVGIDAAAIIKMARNWVSCGGFVVLDNVGLSPVSGRDWSKLPLAGIRAPLAHATQFSLALANHFNLECIYTDTTVSDFIASPYRTENSIFQKVSSGSETALHEFLSSTPPNLF